jgi:putative hemolysin
VSVIAIEVIVILVLLLLNGIFAMSEMAVVSARKVRLERRAEGGDHGARAALRLVEDPTRFLSSVQVGITLIGVLSGAFGGATIAEELAARLERIPALAEYADAIALAIVVTAITYMSLVIGELVPKRIALRMPEAVASRLARPVSIISRIFTPLVAVLTVSTNVLLRLLQVRSPDGPRVTEEEIRALVEEAAESGVVQPAEHQIVESAFRLGDRTVASIMTPRPDVDWIDAAGSPDTIRARLATGRTRYLLCEGSVDEVLGVVHTEELLAKAISGRTIEIPADLRETLWKPMFVPDSMPVFALLEEFRRTREQVAVALDEFGGVQGVVTLDDILDALVGDLTAHDEEKDPLVVRRDDGNWLVAGNAPVDQVESRLGLEPLPHDQRRGFRTAAGFVLTRLGRVPKIGESVYWSGARFEVVKLDGRRIDRLLVTWPQNRRSPTGPAQ